MSHSQAGASVPLQAIDHAPDARGRRSTSFNNRNPTRGLTIGSLDTTLSKGERLRPEQYAEAIKAHSQTSALQSLWPGHSYTFLANILRAPAKPASGQGALPNGRISPSVSGAPFFSSFWFDENGPPHGPRFQVSPENLTNSDSLPGEGKAPGLRLIFLRGQPSPEWIKAIGAKYHVDPEFFRRHLDIQTHVKDDPSTRFFGRASMPSSLPHIFTLRFTTIGERRPQEPNEEPFNIDECRMRDEEAMNDYRQNLRTSLMAGGQLCESIVRRLFTYDKTHFTLEQNITVWINRQSGVSTVIAWLDSGVELATGPEGPWRRHAKLEDPMRRSFYPVLQTLPGVVLKSHRIRKDADVDPYQIDHAEEGVDANETRNAADGNAQSSYLLPFSYGKSMNHKCIVNNPFHVLHELFMFCGASKVQHLNLLAAKIDNASRERDAERGYSDLLQIKDIVDAHIDELSENIGTIESHTSSPGKSNKTHGEDSVSNQCTQAAQELIEHYKSLLKRAKSLSFRCTEKKNDKMNVIMIKESNRAMAQAQEVTYLTYLAFFYIPLSFSSSLFGMNVKPINNENNNLWIWAVCSAPLLVISFALLRWNPIKVWKDYREKKKSGNDGQKSSSNRRKSKTWQKYRTPTIDIISRENL